MSKTFDARSVEQAVARRWNEVDAFHAEPGDPGTPYCIVIPPPNVTAALHLGHALNNTLQDILVRWRRMCGDNAVWMPGTDHAGITTQTIVDRRLLAEGKPSLRDYKKMEAEGKGGREKFIEKVQAWKDEYEATIIGQLKAMGCSCDWARLRFTMDGVSTRAVREAFFQLFKAGLIYRGKRLVNWDPATETALADDEVEMREVEGEFYYLKYPLVDEGSGFGVQGSGETGFVTVATTRPETFLGDTAIGVNPKDPERARFIGRKVRLPIVGRVIPVIGDDYVVIPNPESEDPKAKYTSGFLKVTPAHDPNDWEIGLRHNLDKINVLAPDGKISDKHGWSDVGEAGFVVGMDRFEARKVIVKWFEEHGLLAGRKPYRHSVGHSYRSHVPIEPYLSDQWYVKVTDGRLAGAALEAMAADQRDTNTSRDREGADGATGTYFITWGTYGARLLGDPRGTVQHERYDRGPSRVPGSPGLEESEFELMSGEAVSLGSEQRPVVRDTLLEVCTHRGWRLLAANVRTEHVHVVVEARQTPEKVMESFKGYATRRLREAGLLGADQSVWARHGSTRYLNEPKSVAAACAYVCDGQGEDLGGTYRWDAGAESRRPLPHGRGSLSASALRFYPERYAKTFQNWHENIRDWCISRQLWWGHRIPVWSARTPGGISWLVQPNAPDIKAFLDTLSSWDSAGRIARQRREDDELDGLTSEQEYYPYRFVCVNDPTDLEVINTLESRGYQRDPDVLDTWFSSALWPMSTLGWPDESQISNLKSELNTWNPSDVLCTAREIITLWVSRMVMFNLFFRGCLPFKDVFIHAMIQDGDGQKMSKSLGNGVNPLDIIHSHGADAMRYTLAAMTTQTQDVRMPVDVICPHCSETFHPKTKRTHTGYTVSVPVAECPKCRKKMVTSFGLASGEAKATEEIPAARNTSSKFDQGRNFANKVWNAARFVLSGRDAGHSTLRADDRPEACPTASLADKWILSRLARTIRVVEESLRGYEFKGYADALYDFFWRDYCDWYVEAVKPDGADAYSRRVLPAVLDAAVRLMHPVMPFLTEAVWEQLNAWGPERSIEGLRLEPGALCLKARWPAAGGSLIDEDAERAFELVRRVVTAIRNIRSAHNIPPRRVVNLRVKAGGAPLAVLNQSKGLLATLGGAELVEAGAGVIAADGETVESLGEGVELFVQGLEAGSAEKERLTRRVAELKKTVAAISGRLGNPGYTEKAPAHLVEQSKKQLEDARRELEQLEAKLSAMG